MLGRTLLLIAVLGLGLVAFGSAAEDFGIAPIQDASAFCGGGGPGEPCNCAEDNPILRKFIHC